MLLLYGQLGNIDMTFCLALLLIRDAAALDVCGEATEEMADTMSSKEFGVPGRMRKTITNEDGDSPGSYKQLNKRTGG
jgi:hypothetical protein